MNHPDPASAPPHGKEAARPQHRAEHSHRAEAESSESESRQQPQSPEESLKMLGKRAGELFEFAAYYFATRVDAFKVAIKRRIVTASIISVAVLAAAGAIVTATALLCEGICDALTELFGRRWAGELATGVLLLGLVGITAFFGINRIIKESHLRTTLRYEAWRRKQRERYGRDVDDRAKEGNGHE